MAIEYVLTLAGESSTELVAELAVGGAAECRSVEGLPGLVSANLNDRFGYTVSVVGGQDGYYEATADGATRWQWEPDRFVDVSFHMRKEILTEVGVPNMLRSVARVLADTTEDAALVLNSNRLLLTRVGGVLRKHNAGEWPEEDYRDFPY
ncbi:SitI3 family protein [Polymorphospora rubra]|uniref:SitI3 family protein n=1 Tax=Polymorphospora rubra TaxID=338584 RepID=UPI0033F20565